jgi:hypothetical protein
MAHGRAAVAAANANNSSQLPSRRELFTYLVVEGWAVIQAQIFLIEYT